MSKRMFRYVVPVDDRAHGFELSGDPVAFEATADSRAVEFWAENHDGNPGYRRSFRVFGTGHPVPDGAKYVGTPPRTPLGLVWHLYEMPGAQASVVRAEIER